MGRFRSCASFTYGRWFQKPKAAPWNRSKKPGTSEWSNSAEEHSFVVTTYEGDEDIHRALEAGARGYVIKGMPYQTLVEALQRSMVEDASYLRRWPVRWLPAR